MDAPQPRKVLCFNGEPIPRDVVILDVPRFKLAFLYTSTKCLLFIVLVLSEAVLVLERTPMSEPVFDHEKLDVYRLSIDYVAFSYAIANGLSGNNRHARDQWLRAAQSIPLNIAEGDGKHSLKDRSRFFDIARGSALECAAIHDILIVCEAIEPEDNVTGKSQLRRIVAMLTKLVARNNSVSETPSVYYTSSEHKHRYAEHEHEQEQERKPEHLHGLTSQVVRTSNPGKS